MDSSETGLVFTIRAVESIPCSVRGQSMVFDSEGKMLSEPLKTPWRMDWIAEETAKFVDGTKTLPEESRFRIYNPEEPDQYVQVEWKAQ